MRLLHARDHTFQEFWGSKKPAYAIVSHRWTEEELSHQDFLEGKRSGYGWTKISKACKIALSRDLKWIWCDTICIDKKSSAELSEAINSMFKWYRGSNDCYVLLPDVYDEGECRCTRRGSMSGSPQVASSPRVCMEEFKKSDWFKRGWTLQELLAPREVLFYNARYRFIGTKTQLAAQIKNITTIGTRHLVSHDLHSKYRSASIAERMSWASHRETLREEDMAYSLLGIFNFNMPLLYGEGGEKAFLRLQIEIIRSSTDESIFAWEAREGGNGLMARYPSDFASASKILPFDGTRRAYDMTNLGLRIPVQAPKKLGDLIEKNRYDQLRVLIPLNCSQSTTAGGCIAIRAYVRESTSGIGSFMATRDHKLAYDFRGNQRDGYQLDRDTMNCGFDRDMSYKPDIIVADPHGVDNREYQLYFELMLTQ